MQKYGVTIKDGKVITTRGIYRAFKKYDREQFDTLLQNIYEAGVEDGKPDLPEEAYIQKGMSLATDAAVQALEETKGIGEKRREQITHKFREYSEAAFEKLKNTGHQPKG